MKYYSIISPTGTNLGKFNEVKTKRVLSELIRDEFRSKLLNKSLKPFIKAYHYLSWDLKNATTLKNAFLQTPNPSIDHNFPVDFWFYFYDGKFFNYCNHPCNVFVITKNKNESKGSNIPCVQMNNQMIITMANDIGIDYNELKDALNLYKTNKKKFAALYNFNSSVSNVIKNINKNDTLNFNFDDLT